MSLSDCLHKIKFASEDAAEIRAAVEKAGDDKKGVQAWLDAQKDDLEDLRAQLGQRGFDFEPRRAKTNPEMRASLRPVGQRGDGGQRPLGNLDDEAPRPRPKLVEPTVAPPKQQDVPQEEKRPILTTRTPAQPVERVRWVRPEEDAKPPRSTAAARMAPIQGTGKTRVRGVAQRMNDRYVEDGNIEGLGELPTYEQLSMADQTQQALEVLKNDPQRAYDIAMGDKAPPKGVLAEMFHMAVEEAARVSGDVDTLRDLATKSKLLAETTNAGQRIRAWGERDKSSPAAALKEIYKARLDDYQRRTGETPKADLANEVAEIKAALKSKPVTREEVDGFISSIACGV
jgi:hypothetical protein